jgi:hypothetical protein
MYTESGILNTNKFKEEIIKKIKKSAWKINKILLCFITMNHHINGV